MDDKPVKSFHSGEGGAMKAVFVGWVVLVVAGLLAMGFVAMLETMSG
jgi:hypothetical protein